ncbi:MAG: quinohemoprotein amine dehydrogenase subunit alpha [Planctomycetes bacterium]|nr:quinohemoprotein amine dehydrogenase subunit alpha [Planctomycetota bacterium]
MPDLVRIRATAPLLALLSLLLAIAGLPAQQPGGHAPPPAHPSGSAAATEAPAHGHAAAPAAGGGAAAAGVSDETGDGDDEAAQDPQPGEDQPGQDKDKPADKPKKPGIPVEDPLVHGFCSRCHQRSDDNLMTRISYVRKSPEGWSQSIKRMGRLHGLQLTPEIAKNLVRSLSNSHGLARNEAERALYESERRVHWSEQHEDQDFLRACAQCHPVGRALLQYRDKDEWQLLRATHVAMFPLSRGQMGGGAPEERSNRRPPGFGGGGDGGPRREGSVGDRVLEALTRNQPLFTPEWERWQQNRRLVPLAGTWAVTGHETGRGDVSGTVTLRSTGEDDYDLTWNLRWSDGSTAVREGKGILYAGYSWRGRAKDPDGSEWREVLLLDDAWQTFKGRLFTGNYDELGVDVVLHRDDGRPHLVAASGGAFGNALEVGRTGQRVEVLANAALPATLDVADFHLGDGLTATAVERLDDRRVALTVDVAADAKLGTRLCAYGPHPGGVELVLYDTVDYVRIRPLQGLSRVGGARHPNQLERFEAYAVHRGKDEKPFTEDDVDLFQVRPSNWALAEFAVREDDDDLQYVGSIDARSGVFTPNVDGPNPQRKWQANNVGDVFVTCSIELDVAVRPEPKKETKKEGDQDGKPTDDAKTEPPPPPTEPAVAQPARRERKTFAARSHLLVTVPIYVRWQVLDWEDR